MNTVSENTCKASNLKTHRVFPRNSDSHKQRAAEVALRDKELQVGATTPLNRPTRRSSAIFNVFMTWSWLDCGAERGRVGEKAIAEIRALPRNGRLRKKKVRVSC